MEASGNRIRVVNASISGETTHGGLERLAALLDQHQPNYLIIELGGNDGLRGYSFKQTQQNLEQMVQMARQRDIPTMLVGVRLPPNLGPVYNQRFQRIFEAVTDRHEVVYLPRFLEGVAASDPTYMQADGIHPTATAQPILAERVYQHFTSGFLQ